MDIPLPPAPRDTKLPPAFEKGPFLGHPPEEDFDFSVLWQDEEEGGLIKFVPLISLLFEFIILILLIIKK